MNRFFNTAGPIRREDHYFVEPLDRIDLYAILSLSNQEKCFVLHAPRQTGKTSFLLAFMDYLNRGGKYKSLNINIEVAQAGRENIKEGIRTILQVLAQSASILRYVKQRRLR